MTPALVFYISGHGFGHASRNIEVITALLARSAELRVIARTTAPQWLFDRTITPQAATRFTRIAGDTDTGAVQIDSLHLDEQQTVEQARRFMRDFDARVDTEADFLRGQQAQLVVADIPPLGLAAAARAGVDAVAFGNFTWDWIYSAYPDATDVVAACAAAYRTADTALRLPMHGGFATVPRIVDVPLVARKSKREPADTRRALGLPTDGRLVLLSFGGYGLGRIDPQALARLDGYTVIGSAAHPLAEDAMYAAGFRYEDLVRAVDVVVTKPGYGIISECIANDTALLYTSRGRFPEYEVLVDAMARTTRAAFISHDDLFAGRWQAALDQVLALPAPDLRPAVNGAAVVAEWLLERLVRGCGYDGRA